MKKVLLVGGIGAGKSTFRQQLLSEPIEYAKTQALEVHQGIVDSPGEYLERGHYWRALQFTSYDVDVVALLIDPTANATRMPPGFATSFACPVVGVVTKATLASEAQLAQAQRRLEIEGADPVLVVDSLTGAGFEQVREVLCRAS